MDSSSAQFQQKYENTCGNISENWTTHYVFKLLHTTNLNDNQVDELSLMSNSEWSSSTKSMKKTTNQPSAGNKIPTIINGRVMNGDIKKPSRTLVHHVFLVIRATNMIIK